MTMQWLLSAIEMGAHGFFADKAILTPDMARELLDRNPANRSIVRSRVETYANDMRAGRWAFNGEPLRTPAPRARPSRSSSRTMAGLPTDSIDARR